MQLLRRHWWYVLAAIASLELLAYFLNFGLGSHGFSRSTEDWGRFGEYVGGVFGILAFVGVLITIDLQRRQLEQLSRQATVDELLRIARVLAGNIDSALERQIIMDSITLTAMNSRGMVVPTMKTALELAADVAVPKKGRERDTMFIAKHHGSIKIAMDLATPRAELACELHSRCLLVWRGLSYYHHRVLQGPIRRDCSPDGGVRV